jgi:hypothetical protein
MNYPDLSLSLVEALVRAHGGPAGKRQTSPQAEGPPPRPPFSITISREVGALGRSVAAEVGRRLGWPVYDREILEKIAEEIRRPTSRVERADERPVSWLEDCLSGLLDAHHVGADAYIKYLLGALRGLGVVGRCVIVGRGANFVLPAETTLRVRLVADREDRVRVMTQRLGLSAREAAAWVDATERQRAAFGKRYFGKDTTDPHLYDLVLNTSRLSVEAAADAVIQALRHLEGRGPESAGLPAGWGAVQPGPEAEPKSAALT